MSIPPYQIEGKREFVYHGVHSFTQTLENNNSKSKPLRKITLWNQLENQVVTATLSLHSAVSSSIKIFDGVRRVHSSSSSVKRYKITLDPGEAKEVLQASYSWLDFDFESSTPSEQWIQLNKDNRNKELLQEIEAVKILLKQFPPPPPTGPSSSSHLLLNSHNSHDLSAPANPSANHVDRSATLYTADYIANLCEAFKIPFVDLTFPPKSSPTLYRDYEASSSKLSSSDSLYIWKRPYHQSVVGSFAASIFEGNSRDPYAPDDEDEDKTPALWKVNHSSPTLKDEPAITPLAVGQGRLGNCAYISGISGLAEYPERIQQIFHVARNLDLGIIRGVMCKNGWRRLVVIDDLIPTRDGIPAFASNHDDPTEMWPSMMEKFCAKLFGSYAAIGSGALPEKAICDMIGTPYRKFSKIVGWKDITDCDHSKPKLSKIGFDFFNYLLECDRNGDILSIYTPGSDDSEYNKNMRAGDASLAEAYKKVGLVTGHAYTVIRVAKYNGNRLFKIRNPHMHREWTGKWGDNDHSSWTSAAKRALDYKDADDGTYWMEFCDVFKYFEGGAVNHILNGWSCVRVAANFERGLCDVVMRITVLKKKNNNNNQQQQEPVKFTMGLHQEAHRGKNDKQNLSYFNVALGVVRPSEKSRDAEDEVDEEEKLSKYYKERIDEIGSIETYSTRDSFLHDIELERSEDVSRPYYAVATSTFDEVNGSCILSLWFSTHEDVLVEFVRYKETFRTHRRKILDEENDDFSIIYQPDRFIPSWCTEKVAAKIQVETPYMARGRWVDQETHIVDWGQTPIREPEFGELRVVTDVEEAKRARNRAIELTEKHGAVSSIYQKYSTSSSASHQVDLKKLQEMKERIPFGSPGGPRKYPAPTISSLDLLQQQKLQLEQERQAKLLEMEKERKRLEEEEEERKRKEAYEEYLRQRKLRREKEERERREKEENERREKERQEKERKEKERREKEERERKEKERRQKEQDEIERKRKEAYEAYLRQRAEEKERKEKEAKEKEERERLEREEQERKAKELEEKLRKEQQEERERLEREEEARRIAKEKEEKEKEERNANDNNDNEDTESVLSLSPSFLIGTSTAPNTTNPQPPNNNNNLSANDSLNDHSKIEPELSISVQSPTSSEASSSSSKSTFASSSSSSSTDVESNHNNNTINNNQVVTTPTTSGTDGTSSNMMTFYQVHQMLSGGGDGKNPSNINNNNSTAATGGLFGQYNYNTSSYNNQQNQNQNNYSPSGFNYSYNTSAYQYHYQQQQHHHSTQDHQDSSPPPPSSTKTNHKPTITTSTSPYSLPSTTTTSKPVTPSTHVDPTPPPPPPPAKPIPSTNHHHHQDTPPPPPRPLPKLVNMIVTAVSGTGLVIRDINGKSDPYLTVAVVHDPQKRSIPRALHSTLPYPQSTPYEASTLEPVWGHSMSFVNVDPKTDLFEITCWDKDFFGRDEFMGSVFVSVESLGLSSVKRSTAKEFDLTGEAPSPLPFLPIPPMEWLPTYGGIHGSITLVFKVV